MSERDVILSWCMTSRSSATTRTKVLFGDSHVNVSGGSGLGFTLHDRSIPAGSDTTTVAAALHVVLVGLVARKVVVTAGQNLGDALAAALFPLSNTVCTSCCTCVSVC